MPAQIKTTVFDDLCAKPFYTSYTLSNTPFYFKPVWSTSSEAIKYSQYQVFWNFGDGTTFTGATASHFYKYPGIYNVTATFYDLTGSSYTENKSTDNTVLSLTAVNAIPDVVVFDNLLPGATFGVYALPAGVRSKPLSIRRYNSWQNDGALLQNNYTINLYASGSNSSYFSPEEYYSSKWSHLKNFHTFIENSINEYGYIDNKVINSTTTNSVSIFAYPIKLPFDNGVYLTFSQQNTGNSVFCGTSGTVSNGKTISYVDQTPSNVNVDSLIFLYATPDPLNYVDYGLMQNDYFAGKIKPEMGYINLPWQTQFLKSTFNPAEKIEITSNGITVEGIEQTLGPLSAQQLHSFNIYPIKWTNSNISFVITFKDKNEYTTKCYPPITGYRFDGQEPSELNTVSLSLYKFVDVDPFEPVVLSSVRVPEAIFTKNTTVPEFKSGSYFAGILTVPVESKVSVICASALIKDQPNFIINTTYGFAAQPGQKTIKRLSKRPVFENCNDDDITLRYLENIDTYTVTTSSSVPISIAPLETFFAGIQDRVWVADPDTDKISIFTKDGEYITQISLSGAPVYTGATTPPNYINMLGPLNCASPSNIAIDKLGNAWITLMDAVSTIKISNDLLCVVNNAYPNLQNIAYVNGSLYTELSSQLSGFVGENSLLPAAVDTTTTNDIFVCYSHPVSGFIFKYNSTGSILTAIPITPLHSIQEIVVDKYDNLWAIANNLNSVASIDAKKDLIYKWDKNLNLISGFPKLLNGAIGNITIDKKQGAWVSVSFTNLANIDNLGNVYYYHVGEPATFLYSSINSLQYMGGIASDNEGFLWLLHNIDGKLYYFPIYPEANQLPLSTIEFGNLTDISLFNEDGSRAFYSTIGDWTGTRWVNKYYDPEPPLPRIIRGSSNLFDVLETKPVINKINENFDALSNFKSFILQESLFDRPQLIDNFIGQIIGTYNSDPESLGKTIYEKIANFVSNNNDIETCNVNALKSLTLQFGENFKEFYTSSPSKFRRALDILSVNHKKLFGSPNLYSSNFGLSSQGYNIGYNLGEKINIENGTFVVGEPIVAYEKFSEKYKLINNTIIPETDNIPVVIGSSYPLSCVNYSWGWGLVTGTKSQSGIDIDPYYIFYRYKPGYVGGFKDGIVDFTNELTTITPTESSYQDWTKFGGGIDKVLSRTLSDGLGLI